MRNNKFKSKRNSIKILLTLNIILAVFFSFESENVFANRNFIIRKISFTDENLGNNWDEKSGFSSTKPRIMPVAAVSHGEITDNLRSNSVLSHVTIPYSIPSGFYLLSSDIGVELYKKDYSGGQPDFVQVVNLKNNASIQLLHGSIADMNSGEGSYGGNNASFWRDSLSIAWGNFSSTYNDAFCITNGQFFSTNDDPTPLAFPLKKDGNILSDGYGSSYEYPGQLLILELWSDHANIRELTRDNLYNSSAPNILGGLTEDANKGITNYVGRTFVGIDDSDGNGTYETVLIFNSLYATQTGAASVLRDFGADKVIMFDGGGSTQLRCGSTNHIYSSRTIPQTIGVVAGNENQPSCPDVSGEVILFDDPNCGGSYSTANDVGLWSMANSFNDRAESIAIPNGWSARLYLHDSETSPSKCFNSTDTDLSNNTFSDGTTVSNEATWMRVYDTCDCPEAVTDNAEFLSQSIYPLVETGQSFQIYFEVKNNGSSTWSPGSYWLQNIQNPMGAELQQPVSQSVAPNQKYRWTMNLTAPNIPGTYRSQWWISHNGTTFGPNMFIDVTVQEGPPEAKHAVQFYLDWHYENGYCSTDEIGNHPNFDMCSGYDEGISSVVLQQGWSVRVFKDRDMNGTSKCITANDSDFSNDTFVDGTPLNDQVSSFVLFNRQNCNIEEIYINYLPILLIDER